jgi:hypothetical protein
MSPRPIAYPGARISPALFVYSAIGIRRAIIGAGEEKRTLVCRLGSESAPPLSAKGRHYDRNERWSTEATFRSITQHPTQVSLSFGRWLRQVQSPRMAHSTGGYNPRRLEIKYSCRNNAMLEIIMGRKYQSILKTVGNTPVVRINRFGAARREPVREN